MNYILSNIVEDCKNLEQVYKSDLKFGDKIILETINSVYSISVLDSQYYMVSGGWFDKNKLSSAFITIRGCTWGGSIIKTDIVAACGLQVEFGNKVVTSRIKKIVHIRGFLKN